MGSIVVGSIVVGSIVVGSIVVGSIVVGSIVVGSIVVVCSISGSEDRKQQNLFHITWLNTYLRTSQFLIEFPPFLHSTSGVYPYMRKQ